MLASLRAQPPEWFLHMPLSREEFLRVFPSGTGESERFENLEAWLRENYAPAEDPAVNIGGYRLWHILEKGEKR